MKLIIPNADTISEQIEMFRKSITKEKQKYVQKINNIGIMGARGAGKTSVLRTFYRRLEDNNTHNDVILPIIIPENMSSEAVLMDVILGTLKTISDKKIEDNKEKSKGDCIRTSQNNLQIKYNKLVQQYCYIKKDYRDIIIQQFTTEQYYLDKTKQIFNSDTEFLNAFNDFLEELLMNGASDYAMLFLFIDDIDLSTTRCMDVVKTLLSYLANERIVTFISGDMTTFEEALTLEFLRQENALQSDVQNTIYYSTTGKDNILLERKKKLAYEYLKKIIPPAYRYQIKKWSLMERGRYQVSNENGDQQESLGQLLRKFAGSRVENAFFMYYEQEEWQYFSVVYHMFDDTSRGLNNVYNVLLSLIGDEQEENETYNKKARTLLEAIVASKIDYTRQRDEIFNQVIDFEKDKASMNYENAYKLLENEQDRVRKYSLFLLFEFARQLLRIEVDNNKIYEELKLQIIVDYINDESIEGNILLTKDEIDFFE